MQYPRQSHARLLLASVALCLSGCATGGGAGAPAVAPAAAGEAAVAPEKSESADRAEKFTDPSEAVAAAPPATARDEAAGSAPTPRSDVPDNRSPTAVLVAQLNEATRELGTLRAANAKLKAERAPPPAPRAEPAARPRPDPVDEKLAASLHSYAAFKLDLTAFLAEIEKVRTDNAALNAQLKDFTTQAREMKAALADVQSELLAEKETRARAEQDAAKLRDQLRAIARALAAAGLSLDKLGPGSESTARLETSPARLQSRTAAPAIRKHVVAAGDTLEKIADFYYGDAAKWRLILDTNRARLPLDGTLEPGLELDIPKE